MVIKYILLAICGLSAGTVVAAGVFALITSTGVVTRMADKTHTGKYVKIYEDAIVLGGAWWNLFWVLETAFHWNFPVAEGFQMIMGLCQGIFVGCLAVSLAEALNVTAIFSRRTKLKVGLSFIVLSLAIGKVAGSLLQIIKGWML